MNQLHLALRPRLVARVFATLLALAVAACGNDDADPGNTPMTQTLVAAEGGVLSIDGADARLRGLRVAVPAGALSGDSETITVRHEALLPAPLSEAMQSAGLTPLTPLIVLERSGGSGAFAKPVLLRLPVSPAAMVGREVMPAVWDVESSRWLPLEVVAVDRDAGHVYALIGHFSSVVVAGYIPDPTVSVNTGFDMAVHGFEHPNVATVFDDGDCYGIASFALWNFRFQPTRDGGLYRRFGGGDGSFFGDWVVREVMREAQRTSLPENRRVLDSLRTLTEPGLVPNVMVAAIDPSVSLPRYDPITLQREAGLRLIRQLRSVGPQLLDLANSAAVSSRTVYHSVLVTRYEADASGGGAFYAYDPNLPHPAAPLEIRWSPALGFLAFFHPQFGSVDRFWLASSETWFAPDQMKRIDEIAATLVPEKGVFNVFKLLNADLGAGVYACIVGQDTLERCNLQLSPVTNPVGTDPKDPKAIEAYHLSAFNRTGVKPLLSAVRLADKGNVAQSVRVDTALLGTGASAIEMIVASNDDKALRIEETGAIARYRAFLKAQVKPVRLGIGGKVTVSGYMLFLTLDGAPVPVGAVPGTQRWTLAAVPQGETTNGAPLFLPTATPPIGEVEVEVMEDFAGIAVNPRARAVFGDRYNVKYTVRDVKIGTAVSTTCNGIQCDLFCGVGGAQRGDVERFIDRWTLTQSGSATLVSPGDNGDETVTGSYAPIDGTIRIESTDSEEVTPAGSRLRYWSDGALSWNLRLQADGSIRGTFRDSVTTRWSFDGRRVTCTNEGDYEAVPLPN